MCVLQRKSLHFELSLPQLRSIPKHPVCVEEYLSFLLFLFSLPVGLGHSERRSCLLTKFGHCLARANNYSSQSLKATDRNKGLYPPPHLLHSLHKLKCGHVIDKPSLKNAVTFFRPSSLEMHHHRHYMNVWSLLPHLKVLAFLIDHHRHPPAPRGVINALTYSTRKAWVVLRTHFV